MVGVVREVAVVPEQTEVTVVHLDACNETFAQEIRLIFREVHVVLVTQRRVHHHQRVQGKVGQSHRLGVDPAYGTGGL